MLKFQEKIGKVLTAVLFVSTLGFGMGGGEFSSVGMRYGPNLSWSAMGNTPFVWGEWLPQLVGSLRYVWLEPLDELNYGEKLLTSPTYLKMDASIEVSPFYAGYSLGLGLRPFKTNPQFEFNFTYESSLYIKSNLEMVTSDVTGIGRIAETWNADYVVDNIWTADDAEFDYSQSFDFAFVVDYFFAHGGRIGVDAHYMLSDISTDFDGKSYDYKINIPVFSRDFIFLLDLYGRVPVGEYFAIVFNSSFISTGYLRNGSTVERESLNYAMAKIGPHFSWKQGFQNVMLQFGFWKRLKDRFYDGSLAQEFIVQLEYTGYFSFPFQGN